MLLSLATDVHPLYTSKSSTQYISKGDVVTLLSQLLFAFSFPFEECPDSVGNGDQLLHTYYEISEKLQVVVPSSRAFLVGISGAL